VLGLHSVYTLHFYITTRWVIQQNAN